MPLARTDTSPLFGSGASSTLRLIVYLAAGVVLMVADYRGHYLARVRQYAAVAVEPVYRAAAMPADAARSLRLAMADRQALTEENQRLREALLLTQARLNRLGAVAEQNSRLKELLEVQHSLGLGVQLAKLIDIVLDPYRQRITLDAGARQGVVTGQAVLDAYGVMGQISEVLPTTSTAVLITDSSHAVPVMVERTGLRTIAYGSGSSDRLNVPNIPVSADIKAGDKLITSGLGGGFPAGFPVGEIISVGAEPSGMFAVAVAKPAAALERSGEVLLLRPLAEPVGPPAPRPDEAAAGAVAPNSGTPAPNSGTPTERANSGTPTDSATPATRSGASTATNSAPHAGAATAANSAANSGTPTNSATPAARSGTPSARSGTPTNSAANSANAGTANSGTPTNSTTPATRSGTPTATATNSGTPTNSATPTAANTAQRPANSGTPTNSAANAGMANSGTPTNSTTPATRSGSPTATATNSGTPTNSATPTAANTAQRPATAVAGSAVPPRTEPAATSPQPAPAAAASRTAPIAPPPQPAAVAEPARPVPGTTP